MRRILSIAMGSLVATAIVAAIVAASASNSASYQGAMIQESYEVEPDPDTCGPSGLAVSLGYSGRDTLGGVFEWSTSYCVVELDQPGTWRIFDSQSSGRYLVTGEEWTSHFEDYVAIGSGPPACAEVPAEPIKFTISGFTGEHAGGWVTTLGNEIQVTSFCRLGIFLDPPSIIWFEGVFTPKSCGLGFELALLLPVVMGLRRRRLR